MLMAGNYRCISQYPHEHDFDSRRSVWKSGHKVVPFMNGSLMYVLDLVELSRILCRLKSMPLPQSVLSKPSSAARALADGATYIERVDKLVARIASQQGKELAAVNTIVENVDTWLAENEKKAAIVMSISKLAHVMPS